MLALIRFLILVPILGALFFWALFNNIPIEWVYFPNMDALDTSLPVFMLVVFALGYLAGAFMLWVNVIRKPSDYKSLKNQLREKEAENKALKKQVADYAQERDQKAIEG